MAWTEVKIGDCELWMTFQGVDSYDDIGDDTKGKHVTLQVLGAQPSHTPMAEPKNYVGGGYKACRQKWRDFLVKFRPFSVKASTSMNDYADYMWLRNVFAYKYTAIVATNLVRAWITGGNYWDASHLPIVVELMGKIDISPNYDTGRDELELELREPLLYNPT